MTVLGDRAGGICRFHKEAPFTALQFGETAMDSTVSSCFGLTPLESKETWVTLKSPFTASSSVLVPVFLRRRKCRYIWSPIRKGPGSTLSTRGLSFTSPSVRTVATSIITRKFPIKIKPLETYAEWSYSSVRVSILPLYRLRGMVLGHHDGTKPTSKDSDA
jgi:hypothetical protein